MVFSEHFLKKWNPLIKIGSIVHDVISDFLARHLKAVKIVLLLLAHISLIGLFFPQLASEFGSQARNLLFIIVLVSPLSKLFRMKLLYQMMGLRRELGIWFAYLAIVHSTGYFLDPEWFDFFISPFLSNPIAIVPRYLYGIIALILTLPLLITSNSLSVRILRANWKRVHFLTYPMFAFVLMHSFLPSSTGITNAIFAWIQFGLVFGGYVLFKALAKNNFLTPLREVIDYVGQRYREYHSIRPR